MLAGYGWKKTGASAEKTVDRSTKAVIDIYGPYDLTILYARQYHIVTTFMAPWRNSFHKFP
jgi:hypothetical protein